MCAQNHRPQLLGALARGTPSPPSAALAALPTKEPSATDAMLDLKKL